MNGLCASAKGDKTSEQQRFGGRYDRNPGAKVARFGGRGYTADDFDQPAMIDDELRASHSYALLFLGEVWTHKLTAGLNVNFNSGPGVGVETTDTVLTAGIAVKSARAGAAPLHQRADGAAPTGDAAAPDLPQDRRLPARSAGRPPSKPVHPMPEGAT